jgi:hypothetical protein
MIVLRDFDFVVRSQRWTPVWKVGGDKVVFGFWYRGYSDTGETAATCRHREQRTCQVSERRLRALHWITGADAYCRRNIDRTKTVPPKERLQNCIGKRKVVKRFNINGSLLPTAPHPGPQHDKARSGPGLGRSISGAAPRLRHGVLRRGSSDGGRLRRLFH